MVVYNRISPKESSVQTETNFLIGSNLRFKPSNISLLLVFENEMRKNKERTERRIREMDCGFLPNVRREGTA